MTGSAGLHLGCSSRRHRPPPQVERGSGTMLVVAAVLLIALAGTVVMLVGGTLAAVERVRGAADLVAVSAAAAQADGGDACVAASRIATANQVELRNCRTAGDLLDFVVTVTVAAPAGSLPDRFGYTARSHAGWVVQ